MKKGISVLLCLVLVLLCVPAASGAEIFDTPVVLPTGIRPEENDVKYMFSLNCGNAAAYELERVAAYEKLHEEYSDAALIAAGEGWVTYKTLLYIEIETAGRSTFLCKRSVTETAFTLSLEEDILPVLANAGLYTHDAIRFRLHFWVVVDSGPIPTQVSAETSLGPYESPATARVVYRGTEGAENPNPKFPFLPVEATPLAYPTRTGYVFAGWVSGKTGGYISELPAGITEYTLTAEWTPLSFRINYVLTTRPGYFVYVDNSGNPASHTYGADTEIFALSSHYGYEFTGWYESPDFSGEKVTSIPADRLGDVVLYARWQKPEEIREEKIRSGHWGDLDDDGEITSADARIALRASVDLVTLPKDIAARADFNRNGLITSGTARQLLRIAVDLDSIEDTLVFYGLL